MAEVYDIPAPVVPADDLAAAQGLAVHVEYRGRTWPLKALTLRDMGTLTQVVGDLAEFDPDTNFDHRMLVAWLMLRKADPDLSDADRAARRYRLTQADVDDLFPVSDLAGAAAFLARVMVHSGFYAPAASPAADNAAEGEAPTKNRRPARTKTR